MSPSCTVLCHHYPWSPGVEKITFGHIWQSLDIQIAMCKDSTFIPGRVFFEKAYGVRALDEHNMNEFWPTYSQPNGWLYEVHSGGWMDHESKRDGFIADQIMPNMREFFLAADTCVSMFAEQPPEVKIDWDQEPIPF